WEAMGHDYPRLKPLAERGPRGGPIWAVTLQSAAALVFVWTSSYEVILIYIGVTLSIFSMLTVVGVFISRARPGVLRPYRSWGHPFTTLLFLFVTLWMVVYTVVERPKILLAVFTTEITGVVLFILSRGPTPKPR